MKTDEGLIRAVGVRGLTAAIINYTDGRPEPPVVVNAP